MVLESVSINLFLAPIAFLIAAIFLYTIIKEKAISIPLSIAMIIISLFLATSGINLTRYIEQGEQSIAEPDADSLSVGAFIFLYHSEIVIKEIGDYGLHVACYLDTGKACGDNVDCLLDLHYPNGTHYLSNASMSQEGPIFNYTIDGELFNTNGIHTYWVYCNNPTGGGGVQSHFHVLNNQSWQAKLEDQIDNNYKTSLWVVRIVVTFFIILTLWQLLNLAASNIQNGKGR